jgi:hypothetical protein
MSGIISYASRPAIMHQIEDTFSLWQLAQIISYSQLPDH